MCFWKLEAVTSATSALASSSSWPLRPESRVLGVADVSTSDSCSSFKPSGWSLSAFRLILNLKTSYLWHSCKRESAESKLKYQVPRRKKGRRVRSVRISNIFREARCFFPSLISPLVSSVSVSPSLPAKWWLSTSEIIHKSFFFILILEWFDYCLNNFSFSVSSHFSSFFLLLFYRLTPSVTFFSTSCSSLPSL